METGEVVPIKNIRCISSATGQVMDEPLTPVAGTFKVKLQMPLCHTGSQRAKTVMSIKVQDRQGRSLLIRSDGRGAAVTATLEALVWERGVAAAKIYLAAHWLPPGGRGGEPTVLRLDVAVPLAPPSPMW